MFGLNSGEKVRFWVLAMGFGLEGERKEEIRGGDESEDEVSEK